jgi:very-short-patch-repair endonuclease
MLRKNPTDTEKFLWKHLRNKQLRRFKFRRQQPIGRYIVDFVNFEENLIIEVDGGQHAIYREHDIIRDAYLKQEGYRILRFWDNEVLKNIEGVLDIIVQNLSPSPVLPFGLRSPVSLLTTYPPSLRGRKQVGGYFTPTALYHRNRVPASPLKWGGEQGEALSHRHPSPLKGEGKKKETKA